MTDKLDTWSNLDNEALGKTVKKMISSIKLASDEQGKMFIISAAMMLCTTTAETNADTATITVEGVKNKTNDFGNWKVTIRRMK